MKFRGGDFSTGTTGNFQPELTVGNEAEGRGKRVKRRSGLVAVFVTAGDIKFGSDTGIRTRVSAVRGRRPRPLDDIARIKIG